MQSGSRHILAGWLLALLALIAGLRLLCLRQHSERIRCVVIANVTWMCYLSWMTISLCIPPTDTFPCALYHIGDGFGVYAMEVFTLYLLVDLLMDAKWIRPFLHVPWAYFFIMFLVVVFYKIVTGYVQKSRTCSVNTWVERQFWWSVVILSVFAGLLLVGAAINLWRSSKPPHANSSALIAVFVAVWWLWFGRVIGAISTPEDVRLVVWCASFQSLLFTYTSLVFPYIQELRSVVSVEAVQVPASVEEVLQRPLWLEDFRDFARTHMCLEPLLLHLALIEYKQKLTTFQKKQDLVGSVGCMIDLWMKFFREDSPFQVTLSDPIKKGVHASVSQVMEAVNELRKEKDVQEKKAELFLNIEEVFDPARSDLQAELQRTFELWQGEEKHHAFGQRRTQLPRQPAAVPPKPVEERSMELAPVERSMELAKINSPLYDYSLNFEDEMLERSSYSETSSAAERRQNESDSPILSHLRNSFASGEPYESEDNAERNNEDFNNDSSEPTPWTEQKVDRIVDHLARTGRISGRTSRKGSPIMTCRRSEKGSPHAFAEGNFPEETSRSRHCSSPLSTEETKGRNLSIRTSTASSSKVGSSISVEPAEPVTSCKSLLPSLETGDSENSPGKAVSSLEIIKPFPRARVGAAPSLTISTSMPDLVGGMRTPASQTPPSLRSVPQLEPGPYTPGSSHFTLVTLHLPLEVSKGRTLKHASSFSNLSAAGGLNVDDSGNSTPTISGTRPDHALRVRVDRKTRSLASSRSVSRKGSPAFYPTVSSELQRGCLEGGFSLSDNKAQAIPCEEELSFSSHVQGTPPLSDNLSEAQLLSDTNAFSPLPPPPRLGVEKTLSFKQREIASGPPSDDTRLGVELGPLDEDINHKRSTSFQHNDVPVRRWFVQRT
eukprot:gb/GEZN01001499.1/.p1 GENE.gb/GEZN01001499.1/~~gb/GEZN01001499.1/.p1  ORF type:complete len:890 (-),score=92.69 gb/GEZN01001499.1/:264-2933(-)